MALAATTAKFLLALALGSTLAAFTACITGAPETFAPMIVVGIAMTFALFGLLPALMFGMPALSALRRLDVSRPVAVCVMITGGAAVGGLMMTVTFTGFERWGAIAGGSVGLMQGLLLHRASHSITAAPST